MTNNIIRVHRPELTTEERAKRMKHIKEAAERLIIATAQTERKVHNERV